MSKAQAALLESMWADLRKTEHGYVEGNGGGEHWTNAERKHQQLRKQLLGAPPASPFVFPIATDLDVLVGEIHTTAGIPGNEARDFIVHAGTGIVAPEAGEITRFSGHDPSDDVADKNGVFGWSTYLETAAGYEYFITHQGRRYPTLRVGMRVQAGDLLGYVGDQRYRSDHAHIGVTSPKGTTDAKARITAVSRAPRVS